MGTATQASRTLARRRLVRSANSSSKVERRSVKVNAGKVEGSASDTRVESAPAIWMRER